MSEKKMTIKYLGKMGETAETPFGIWTKGELHDVPEQIGKQMIRTGHYAKKGERMNVPDKSPDIDLQEQAEGARPAVASVAETTKPKKK